MNRKYEYYRICREISSVTLKVDVEMLNENVF
jgi:hypothetical protein